MKKYKIGIIGYGGFGRFLHHWWSAMENVEVIAVADHGHHFREIRDLKIYDDWNDLIADPEIDIVSIVTPPSLHSEMACAAMRAGKHVILEKPVAITEESAQRIIETQQETGMVITVDHMIRYNPIIQNLMAIGRSGAFGQLRHVVVNNYAQDEALPVSHWFWNEELSGGILVEHGVHFFDIVNALGEQNYTEVCGNSHSRNESQRDRVAALVKYDKGLIASYYHAFSGPGLFEQTTIELAYDLARIQIEGWMPLKGTAKAMIGNKTKSQLDKLPGWTVTTSENFATLGDVSRPEGWGESDEAPANTGHKLTYCGGIAYDVDTMVSGTFEIPQSKGQVYGKCVQDILADVIRKIEDPGHELTITLEDAVEALKLALLATTA